MAILAMPSAPGFSAARFTLTGRSATAVSPLTGAAQTVEMLGSRWLASLTLPPLTAEQAAPWCIFLARLQGRAGRFYAGDPSALTPRGTATTTGTRRVNGASQTGRILRTDGWTTSQAAILKAGDYLSYDTPSGWRQLHKVTADTPSDAGGRASLPVIPPIRESPADDAAITVTSPTGVFMLATDDDGQWTVDSAGIYTISFNAEEAFAPSEA